MHAKKHALYLAVQTQAVQAFFTADTAVLEAAKGRGNVGLLIRIDPDRSSFDLSGDPPCTGIVACPHTCSQAEYRVVSLRYDVAFIFERNSHKYRRAEERRVGTEGCQ